MKDYLCPACNGKPQPAGTFHGTCHVRFSTGCKAWTAAFVYTICEPCAQELGQCAWCLGPISGSSPIFTGTTKDFVFTFQVDNGIHIEGMNVGEQVLVQLVVEVWNSTWVLSRALSSPEVSFYGTRLIRDPENYRQGTREVYIDLDRPAERAKIGLLGPSGATWNCTVEIRQR